jgi:hypothetical protein
MRIGPTLLSIVLVASLLSMQLSGLHLHVNSDGNGGLHGPHVHDAAREGHSHESDTDVSLLEFFFGWMKLLSFFIPLVFVLLSVMQRRKIVWAPITHSIFTRGQSRWRPPLRAPPIPVS